MVEPHVRDLIILAATTLVFVLTIYILSLRVTRERELKAQLNAARSEIAALRARLADATRPPTQFARMRMREVAVNRFARLRLAAPRRSRIAETERVRERIR